MLHSVQQKGAAGMAKAAQMAGTGARVTREPMSRVDTAWLRMERPTNPMMITGVLMFDEPISLAALRRTVRDRFLSYARFQQKAVQGAAGWHWQTDPDFDLDWHVRLSGLPGRGDKRALERFASQLASSPLDPHRPMWQFHLVERYHGGSAVVARIHHCYADGIALVQVLLSMTDTERKATPRAQLARTWLKDEHHRVAQRVGAVDRYKALGSRMVGGGMAMVQDPTLAAILAREGGDLAAELVHVLAMPDDPPSLLRGTLGVSKRVAWAEPLDLDDVKAVSRACDCTVNDVLMAAAAGALRGYIEERGDDVDGLTIRATVPVNMRPLEHARQLGNHFGLVYLELPIGESNPLRRLERVVACMRGLKRSKQPLLAYGLLAALGMAPAAVQEAALDMLAGKASVVATNVPGPQQRLYMAGSPLREMMFWVPQTGAVGVGISILSYRGRVHFGLIADAKLIPDPEAVIRRFGAEFDKLLYLALMGNWDRPLDARAALAVVTEGTTAA